MSTENPEFPEWVYIYKFYMLCDKKIDPRNMYIHPDHCNMLSENERKNWIIRKEDVEDYYNYYPIKTLENGISFSCIYVKINKKSTNLGKLYRLRSGVSGDVGFSEELYEPYIKHAKYHECIKIHGDALNYRDLLKGYNADTVLMVDFLEHLEYETAIRFIKDLKVDFKKILLMLPVGDFPHNQDITGHGGHEYQTHRSSWYEEDIKKLNFTQNKISLPYYNWRNKKPSDNYDSGCYFGVWEGGNDER